MTIREGFGSILNAIGILISNIANIFRPRTLITISAFGFFGFCLIEEIAIHTLLVSIISSLMTFWFVEKTMKNSNGHGKT